MSEGYVLASATDVNDLLNQIVSQAAVHGWTQNFLGGLGTTGRRGHISREGVTINLASVTVNTTSSTDAGRALNEVIPAADRDTALSYSWGYAYGSPTQYANPDILCINASTGYDGGLAWYKQPGADRKNDGANTNVGRFQCIRAKSAIGKVHMFFYDNPACIVVICEVRPGEYYWLMGGNLQKDYTFDGGQFYGASLWDYQPGNSYPVSTYNVQTRVGDAQALKARGNGFGCSFQAHPDEGYFNAGSSGANPAENYYVPAIRTLYNGNSFPNDDQVSEVQRGYDEATGRLWLGVPKTYALRVGGGTSYLGVLPHMFYTTTQTFVGGETVSLGGVEYMVFPFNWRASPYDWDITTGGIAAGVNGPWYRNNTRGVGLALRKPA